VYKCSYNLDQDLEADRNFGLRIKENLEGVHLVLLACVLLSKFTATLIWMRGSLRGMKKYYNFFIRYFSSPLSSSFLNDSA
jgi:hypothetical protein